MYKLRSGKTRVSVREAVGEYVQTTIEFRKRKRSTNLLVKSGHPPALESKEDQLEVNTHSPPKRLRKSQELATKMCSTAAASFQGMGSNRKTRSSTRLTPHLSSPPSPKLSQTALSTPLKNTVNTPSKTHPSPTPTSSRVVPSPKLPKSAARRLCFLESSPLAEVKRSLHNSLPSSLLCRDEHLSSLTTFLQTHLSEKRSGALYISGAPGTGKTACLTQVLEQSHDLIDPTHIVTVNCMSVKQPQAIYSRIACELLGSKISKVKNVESALLKYITRSKEMTLIVLDEIDQLDSRGQEVLYTLFEWPSLPASKLVLIGIANALDLTDRVLPRLQSHIQCQPRLLHFPPYTKDQIVTILQERLGNRGVVDPMAVQFCARKVSAVHGDARKALDICRRAIERAEAQGCHSSDKENKATPTKDPIRITVRHIADVILEVYSGGVSVGVGGHTLPLQQKLVACTLLCMVRGQGKKETTLGKLYDSYVKVSRHRGLRCEGESEFVGLCEMLETQGLVSTKRAKERKDYKITLKLDEAELEHALRDKLLITSVLEHGIPLSS